MCMEFNKLSSAALAHSYQEQRCAGPSNLSLLLGTPAPTRSRNAFDNLEEQPDDPASPPSHREDTGPDKQAAPTIPPETPLENETDVPIGASYSPRSNTSISQASWNSSSPPTYAPEPWTCYHNHVHTNARPLTTLPHPPLWCPTCPVCTSRDRPEPLTLRQRDKLRESVERKLRELREVREGMTREEKVVYELFFRREYRRLEIALEGLTVDGRAGVPRRYYRTVTEGERAKPIRLDVD